MAVPAHLGRGDRDLLRTRDTEWFLRVELLDILLAPTISMAFVGGFSVRRRRPVGHPCPLGALVFNDARSGVRWFVAFVAVFLASGIVASWPGGGSRFRRGSRPR